MPDHPQHLYERCEENEDRAIRAGETVNLSSIRQALLSAFIERPDKTMTSVRDAILVRSRQAGMHISGQVESMRDIISASITCGNVDVPGATDCLEVIRCLDRVSHPITRISLHLQRAIPGSGK